MTIQVVQGVFMGVRPNGRPGGRLNGDGRPAHRERFDRELADADAVSPSNLPT